MKRLAVLSWVSGVALTAGVALAQSDGAEPFTGEMPPMEEMDIGDIADVPVQEVVEPVLEEGVGTPLETTQSPSFPATNMPQNTIHSAANVRILTFSNNDLHDVVLKAHKPYEYQELTFVLRGCRADVNNIPENDMAWVDVYGAQPINPEEPLKSDVEDAENTAEDVTETAPNSPIFLSQDPQGVPLFSGWLLNQYTDAHTLEHPKYDIRLLSCK